MRASHCPAKVLRASRMGRPPAKAAKPGDRRSLQPATFPWEFAGTTFTSRARRERRNRRCAYLFLLC